MNFYGEKNNEQKVLTFVRTRYRMTRGFVNLFVVGLKLWGDVEQKFSRIVSKNS